MAEAEKNAATVRAAFLPWEQGDSGPFFELVADDVRWTVIGSTPFSGVFESKQALLDGAFGVLVDHLEDGLQTRLVDIIAAGDKVVLQHTSHGIGTNGVTYDQAYCFVMTLRDDRIVEIVAYVDTDLLVRIIA